MARIDRRRQAYLARFSRCDRGGRERPPGQGPRRPRRQRPVRARRGAADPRRDQRLPRQGQVCNCLVRQLWRVRRRHPPLLPGERVRPDLAAADGHGRPDRALCRDPVFQGDPRHAGDRRRIRSYRPLQDRGQRPDQHQHDGTRPRAGPGAARLGLRAGGRRHRGGPKAVAGRGARGDRQRAAAARRGAPGKARRPHRLSRRSGCRRPQARRSAGQAGRSGDLSRQRRAPQSRGSQDRADLWFGADRRRQRLGRAAVGLGRDGRRRCRPRLSRRGARPQGARDPVPYRQPRRLGRCFGDDLARSHAGRQRGQAGYRLDGRCRRLRRLLYRCTGR